MAVCLILRLNRGNKLPLHERLTPEAASPPIVGNNTEYFTGVGRGHATATKRSRDITDCTP
jgi:hypothetical protein